MTRKWIKASDLSSNRYSVSKNIRFKIPTLRSDMSNYHDAYNVVKGTVDLLAATAKENDKIEKKGFKNNASCTSITNNTFLDKIEYLDIIVPMHKTLEYSMTIIL